ncbi:hypothetical protein RRG08_050773, partial [Elysia crispata]
TCPDTWTKSKISRTCVKAFEYRYTWRVARQICQRQDGDLVVVLNSQKYKFLKGLLGNEAYWVGASDTRTLGKLMWNERIPVKYPKNFMRDTIEERLRLISVCGHMERDEEILYIFSCQMERKFVCERTATPAQAVIRPRQK